jgi:hypothetical protein
MDFRGDEEVVDNIHLRVEWEYKFKRSTRRIFFYLSDIDIFGFGAERLTWNSSKPGALDNVSDRAHAEHSSGVQGGGNRG